MSSIELEQDILNITKYGGSFAPKKAISASMFGDDLLKIYLRVKYGVIDSQQLIQDNTLGSLAQLGLDSLADEKDSYEARYRITKKYKDTDWELTAELDLVDFENKQIYDFKVTKEYTFKKINEEHMYAYQLMLQKYLIDDKLDDDFSMNIFMFLKDIRQNEDHAKPINKNVIVNGKSKEEIEEKLDNIISTIESWIKEPDQIEACADLWFRKDKNGNSFPSKCYRYCSYNTICPKFKMNNSFNRQIDRLSWV